MSTATWICPHCDHACVIEYGKNYTIDAAYSKIDAKEGPYAVMATVIACANPTCRRLTINISHGQGDQLLGHSRPNWRTPPTNFRLLPPSSAKPMPDYVPLAIRDDYSEACAILDQSPKAAATLARRALQGIVRDFHGIVDKTLAREIAALQPRIDPLVWDAIDVVRRVGNNGAHMEKVINLVVDVEPEEAERLIRLIELLVSEWYVAKRHRENQLRDIVALGLAKDAMRVPTILDSGASSDTPDKSHGAAS